MKIILNPVELKAAIEKYYPALAGHTITDVVVKSSHSNLLDCIEITMTPLPLIEMPSKTAADPTTALIVTDAKQ